MSNPTLTPDVLKQRSLGYWYDRPNEKIYVATVLSNPTQAKVGDSTATVRVSVSGFPVAHQVVKLSDLIQEDIFTSEGLQSGNFLPHDHTSFSKRYGSLNLPAFDGISFGAPSGK